jgi:signal transduction histidine kinase
MARGARPTAVSEVEALRCERDKLLADRELLVDNLNAAIDELRRNEGRKRVLAQVNDLLDDTLFRVTVARRIAQAAERCVDLGEICFAAFSLMRELTPLRAALTIVDVGERRMLVAEDACPRTAAEDAHRSWDSIEAGNYQGMPGAFTVPIFRGDDPVALIAAYPAKSTGFTARDTEILGLFAEHMRLPLERGAYLERVRDLIGSKEQFMRMLTHDLRNPLTSILSSLWTVTSDQFGLDASQEQQLVGNAFRSAQRLNALLDDLLDLYRLEAGKLQLALAPIDLPGMVREALDQIAPVAAEKGLRVEHALPEHAPPVMADRAKLFRVMANLLSNAVKYTFQGEVQVAVEVTEPLITVHIRDTGLGIAPADAANLFQPFARSAQTAHIKGCGLGLAFCRQMVEAHGGRIWLDSEVGRGSTFHFALPFDRDSAA